MMPTKAPPRARKVHEQKQRAGTLGSGVVVPFRARAEKFLTWRKPKIEEDIEPTPQRKAKGLEREGTRYMVRKAPAQAYQGAWPADVEVALARFVVDSQILSEFQQRVTVNYNGTGGGGDPSTRVGGLGGVPDKVRDVYARYQWCRRLMDLEETDALDRLVLGMPHEATGELTTMSEMGHKLFPKFKDRATTRGISIGTLLAAGRRLHRLYAAYEHKIREDRRR